MAMTVREMCDTLERHHLLRESDLAELRTQWFKSHRKDTDDAARFARWLVANRYATEFVLEAVAAGKASQLIFKQYRVEDRLTSGPMAGALLAVDEDDRKVAIEILSPDIDSATAMAMFQVVMRAVQFRHANVGAILEFNEADGRRYIVKEYYAGETLTALLAKRGKLAHLSAARLFTLAFAGLQALHENNIPGGDLDLDCLLLAPLAKGKRTVKILHAGVKRRRFDNTTPLGVAAPLPADGDIRFQTTIGITPPDKVVPARDLFRLGCAFYQAVTGQAPFEQHELAQPTRRATPVRTLAPQIPGMLAEIIEDLIEPNADQRPKKASHVGKALRVYLAAEEDNLLQPDDVVAPEKAEAEPEKPEVYVITNPKKEPSRDREADKGKPERRLFPPRPRELVYLASGAAFILALIVVMHLATGWTLASLACLMAGCAFSFLLDRLLAIYAPSRRRMG